MSSSSLERFFTQTTPARLSVLAGVYAASLLLIMILGFYMLFYALALLSFLFMVPLLKDTRLFGKMNRLQIPVFLLLLFLLGFGLRGMMLHQDEVITNDMTLMVERSENAIDGDIPYKDFPVNKPPLYLYLAYFVGATFGTGVWEFRLFFSIFDAMVPLALFQLLRLKYEREHAAYAALLYAICPLNIIMIGFSGHYEPLVILPVLGGFYYFFKERYEWACFLLGIGFAFKLYPAVILPFFLVLMPGWKRRILSGISFALPFLLSLVALAFLVEDGLAYYIDYQTGEWISIAIKSFALSFILLLDSETLGGQRITELVMYLFLALIMVLFISWLGRSSLKPGEEGEEEKRKKGRVGNGSGFQDWVVSAMADKPLLLGLCTGFLPVDALFGITAQISEKLNRLVLRLRSFEAGDIILVWYKIMVLTYALYYGLEVATTFKLFKVSWGIQHANPVVYLVLIIFFSLVYLFLKRYWNDIFPKKEELQLDPHQELYYLSTFTIMLLLFSSPDYCPWYLMWFLPMVFSMKNNRVKYFILWIIFWNFPGRDFNIMPGFGF